MMDLDRARLVGDYIVGPKIGSGSFAVVWRARHRKTGHEVAVKEIHKRQLSPKIRESLLKEISILSTIDHPNIIRFLEAIESDEKIYLVLEYCDGGDLAGYINRYGKVSEAVARHFMRQLAAGLQVLHEKHLIHRDLKPQNLLLSSNDPTPLMKIGDFGFARSLSQGLADTLCGSPLYMAPEIIQNKKYDAKADLWSVGAILFQLVTGRPPFDGNSQFQLFQNILTSTDLKFPVGALEELHPDCVDLCRCLLRLNPVERLTFDDFFSHKFLQEPRPALLPMKSLNERSNSSAFPMNLFSVNPGAKSPLLHEDNGEDFSTRRPLFGFMPTTSKDVLRELVDDKHLSKQANWPTRIHRNVPDISDSIEKDYVLVNAHLASIECISYVAEKSQTDSVLEALTDSSKKQNEQTEFAKNLVSDASTILRELQGLAILHPSTRMQLLHQYIQVLVELSQEKQNAELFLESFSVELVILALWKKALQISSNWLASTAENEQLAGISKKVLEGTSSSPQAEEDDDFSKPSRVHSWAEESFLVAFGRAEKLEHHIRDMDGAAKMPDAMEIIFQKALAFGTAGAVDEFVNRSTAAESYSKALLLLSFINEEATMLPLNPPFSLTPDDKKRIGQYIVNLHSRQTNFLKSQPSPKTVTLK